MICKKHNKEFNQFISCCPKCHELREKINQINLNIAEINSRDWSKVSHEQRISWKQQLDNLVKEINNIGDELND